MINGFSGNRLRGDLWAVSSALTTGCGLIAAKAVLKTVNPITFNGYIFAIGVIIILCDAVISRKLSETVRLSFRQVLFMLLISAIFCCATFLLFSALSLAEPATVSFLSRLELIATLILAAILLKERISRYELWGLILVIAGIIVMRYGASIELSRTVALVSLCAVFFGLGEVLIKSKIDWINYRSFILYRNLFVAAIYIVVGLALGEFRWIDDANLLWILVVAGLFLPYMGRLGYLKAMKNINISRASIIVQSQPFFAAAAALIILGTFPSPREIIGGLLIVAGVVVIKLLEKRVDRSQDTL